MTQAEECGTLRFDIAARIVEELRRYTDTPPDRENTIHVLDGAEKMLADLKQIETDLNRTAKRTTGGKKPISSAIKDWVVQYRQVAGDMDHAKALFNDQRAELEKAYQVIYGIRKLMNVLGGIEERLEYIRTGLDKRLMDKKAKKK